MFPWKVNEDMSQSNMSLEEYVKNRYSASKSHLEHCTALMTTQMTGAKCERNNADGCTYVNLVWEIYSNLIALLNVQGDAKDFIDELKVDMNDVVNYIDNFESRVETLDTAVTSIKHSMVSNLIKSVDTFKSRMYCNYMADSYDEIYEYLCIDMLPALVMISLMMLLTGLFLIPLNICIILLAKRLNVTVQTTPNNKV